MVVDEGLGTAAAIVAAVGISLIPVAISGQLLRPPKARRRGHTGSVGLVNGSNLCFLNSLLQSLAAVPVFSDFLAATVQSCDRTRAPLSKELLAVLAQLNGGSTRRAIFPRSLLHRMERSFGDRINFANQQDVQELWQLLMDALNEEAGQQQGGTGPGSLRPAGRPARPPPVPTTARATHGNPFIGLTGDALSCAVCESRRPIRLNAFCDITLDLPPCGSAPTVEDCFAFWLQREALEGVECVSCSARSGIERVGQQERILRACAGQIDASVLSEQLDELRSERLALQKALIHDERDAVADLLRASADAGAPFPQRRTFKQVVLARTPAALCLHINRRKYDASTGRAYKDSRPIAAHETLELEALRLDASVGLPRPQGRYRLSAVIDHRGGPDGGHFTAFRRTADGSWRHFSDESVAACSLKEALSAQLYMLFYESLPCGGGEWRGRTSACRT